MLGHCHRQWDNWRSKYEGDHPTETPFVLLKADIKHEKGIAMPFEVPAYLGKLCESLSSLVTKHFIFYCSSSDFSIPCVINLLLILTLHQEFFFFCIQTFSWQKYLVLQKQSSMF